MDTTIKSLGEPTIHSPLHAYGPSQVHFRTDDDRVLVDVTPSGLEKMCRENQPFPSFEMAGPRSRIYFDPSKLRCALVTCGGLCPGLNDIIRSIVLELTYGYGVHHIYGIKYGLQGFIPRYGHDVIDLTPDLVVNIHARTLKSAGEDEKLYPAIDQAFNRMVSQLKKVHDKKKNYRGESRDELSIGG